MRECYAGDMCVDACSTYITLASPFEMQRISYTQLFINMYLNT